MSETDTSRPAFAHSSEEEFARILDYYKIEWEYEPRTFPLEWDDDGNVTQAFSPDFYLPDQNLYVELTTLRPQLNRRKNRKIRRLRELYPDVNVRLMKRRDIRALMLRYGVVDQADKIEGTDAQEENT